MISIINKLLLGIELVPVMLLLLLSLSLLGDSRPVFFSLLVLSLLSLISLTYIVVKTILGQSKNIRTRFVNLAHIGFVISILGVLIILIQGNQFKNLSPEAPYSIFSFGLIAFIPYFHVMIVNKFFISKL